MVDEEAGGLAQGVRARLAATGGDDNKIDLLGFGQLTQGFVGFAARHNYANDGFRDAGVQERFAGKGEAGLGAFLLGARQFLTTLGREWAPAKKAITSELQIATRSGIDDVGQDDQRRFGQRCEGGGTLEICRALRSLDRDKNLHLPLIIRLIEHNHRPQCFAVVHRVERCFGIAQADSRRHQLVELQFTLLIPVTEHRKVA